MLGQYPTNDRTRRRAQFGGVGFDEFAKRRLHAKVKDGRTRLAVAHLAHHLKRIMRHR